MFHFKKKERKKAILPSSPLGTEPLIHFEALKLYTLHVNPGFTNLLTGYEVCMGRNFCSLKKQGILL